MSSESRTYIFEKSDASERLDVYLCSVNLDFTRTKIQKMISSGTITVNNKAVKPSYKLNTNDIISIESIDFVEPSTKAFQQDLSIEVVFEDSHIIVINKPFGIVTHPGAGNFDGTVANAFFDRLYKCDPIRPGIVHRLDKDTSGLLVLAKTALAFESLSEQFRTKVAQRIYWCICFGRLKSESGKIKTNLARHPKNRKKFSSQSIGKEAITNYKVITSAPLSLVEVALETGRTHQIRVHLSELGHPILSDPIYGSENKINDLQDPVLKSKARKIKRLALVARKLEFTHPFSGEVVKFEVPWPEIFKEII